MKSELCISHIAVSKVDRITLKMYNKPYDLINEAIRYIIGTIAIIK